MAHLRQELEVVEEDFLLNQVYLLLVILRLVEQVVVVQVDLDQAQL
jgi:hypothetical protein